MEQHIGLKKSIVAMAQERDDYLALEILAATPPMAPSTVTLLNIAPNPLPVMPNLPPPIPPENLVKPANKNQ